MVRSAADTKVRAYLFFHQPELILIEEIGSFQIVPLNQLSGKNSFLSVNLFVLYFIWPFLPDFLLGFQTSCDYPFTEEVVFHM
jgi:hypothetical protein